MGSCTRRHYLLAICILQLLTIIERQVMDFLGYMWAPILVNFFHIIFVIFGFFGAYQFRPKYIVTYSVWNFLWIGWNIFLVCFYMNVGSLDRESDVLNLGTGSFSWFLINGYGCKPIYPTNITSEDPFRPIRPEKVDNCVLEYHTVEVVHSSIQIILAILGIIGAITIGKIFIEEDDDRSIRSGVGSMKMKKSKHRQSLYTIDFTDTIRSGHREDMGGEFGEDGRGHALSPKPMTPRRVKRRSVMTRGSSGRQSSSSRRSHSGSRNSVRNSRRRHHQNPVTKLLEQQTSKGYPTFAPRKENSALTASNLKTLNSDLTIPTELFQPPPSHLNQLAKLPATTPDPIYYNMSHQVTGGQTPWNSSSASGGGGGGHFNPTYQHSTPNLTQSSENIDELYNNRPPSVRSSYSNFHGARPLSSTNYSQAPAAENVFTGLSQSGGGGGGIPQLPERRAASRESVRSMAFLNNGPPAYNLNYHTPPDSETTM